MPGVYPRGREGGRGPRGFSALSGPLVRGGAARAPAAGGVGGAPGGLMGAWPQVTCIQSPGGPQAERGPTENLLTLSLAAALSATQTC